MIFLNSDPLFQVIFVFWIIVSVRKRCSLFLTKKAFVALTSLSLKMKFENLKVGNGHPVQHLAPLCVEESEVLDKKRWVALRSRPFTIENRHAERYHRVTNWSLIVPSRLFLTTKLRNDELEDHKPKAKNRCFGIASYVKLLSIANTYLPTGLFLTI